MLQCPASRIVAFLLVTAAASTANAQVSRISFIPSEGTPQYQPLNGAYTSTKLQMVKYSDNSGTVIVDQFDCSATTNCDPSLHGAAAHYRVTMVQAPGNNEERVGSTCNGVADGSDTCYDHPLLVTLRVKTGGLGLQIIGSAGNKPLIKTNTFNLKYLINGNPNAYWQTSAGSVTRFPQGTWTPVPITMPTGECHPEPVNPNIAITVTDNLNPANVVWPWRGTVCDYYVESAAGGGTISDANSDFSCVMPAGEYTRCNFSIPFGDAVRLIATSDVAGGQFTQGGNGPCSLTEPDDVCAFTSNTDLGINVSFSGAPTSPTLTASSGASGPASRAAIKGDTNVVVQQVHIATSSGAPMLQTITINASGTGAPEADITAVKLYLDTNHNGVIDAPDDVVIGTSTFSASGVGTIDAPVTVGAPIDVLVAVDINATIEAAMHAPGAPWSLLFIIALPVAIMWRRRSTALAIAILAIAAATTFACGGGGGGNNDDGDSDQQTGDNGGADNGTGDNGPDDDYVPPTGSKTFAFSVTAMTATKSVSSSAATPVVGLPLTGVTLSVVP